MKILYKNEKPMKTIYKGVVGCIVAQFNPCVRTVTHCSGSRHRISFPYQIFVLDYLQYKYNIGHHITPGSYYTRDFRFGVSPVPLKSPENKIYKFNLPPISPSLGYCGLGGAEETPEDLFNYSIKRFWDSFFSYDYDAANDSMSLGEQTMKDWATLSEIDRDYWKKHPFPVVGSLKDLIHQFEKAGWAK